MEKFNEEDESSNYQLAVDGYKFINPEKVEPSASDIDIARKFLIDSGYKDIDDDLSVGIDLVARMVATAELTLVDAPSGWRFAQDLDAPDGRCVVLLSQKHEDRVSKDLLIAGSFEDSEQIREEFMDE